MHKFCYKNKEWNPAIGFVLVDFKKQVEISQNN
jgi:hypothetical protein